MGGNFYGTYLSMLAFVAGERIYEPGFYDPQNDDREAGVELLQALP